MNNTARLYEQYCNELQKIADVKYAAAVLQWDQETYLPERGAAGRSRQLATLSELGHQMFTRKEFGELLKQLNDRPELTFKQQKNIALTLEDYEKQLRLPSDFVRKMSVAISEAFYTWVEARKQNSFIIYQPALEKLVALKIEEAELLGYTAHRYDALLDYYEKGSTVEMLDKVFSDILQPLKDIMRELVDRPKADDSFLYKHYPHDQQWAWAMQLVKELGFDFKAGRQDISEHPFTTNFSANDVRITTRIDENDLANMTWSCIHETGHALYEQGLPAEEYGLPSGEFASLSIHESQSRLWENCVGRSRVFWDHYLPVLQKYFPDQLGSVGLDQFINAVNQVQPSLIRTEADEVTYHFHVYIRYQLEKQIIEGSLSVKDIPYAWNSMYEQSLGIKVPDDKRGCLQDVHWSHGSFGYFPTYSLGSFYAAQFWIEAGKEIAGIENDISKGNTAGLLAWLREKVHQHGRTYTSEELCTLVTGKGLDSKYFIDYLRNKLSLK